MPSLSYFEPPPGRPSGAVESIAIRDKTWHALHFSRFSDTEVSPIFRRDLHEKFVIIMPLHLSFFGMQAIFPFIPSSLRYRSQGGGL